MADLLVVGSIALDHVITPLGEFQDIFGGNATYFSISAGKLSKVNVVSIIGQDMPQQHIDIFKSLDIDTVGIQRVKNGHTFKWKGYYGFDMNEANTLDTKLGVLEKYKPVIPDDYKKIEYVFLGNLDPEIQIEVLDQLENPKFVALDTMNYYLNTKKDLILEALSKVDLVIINDSEAQDLSGEKYLLSAAKKIITLGPKYVVIKKGENGSLFYSEEGYTLLPSYPVEIVKDPTGAGCTFAGGLIGYIVSQDNPVHSVIKKGVIYGTILSSFVIEEFGIEKIKILSPEDLKVRYDKYINMLTFQ